MAGLNSILSNTETSALTLPKWYDTAQQGVVNASLAQAQAPSAAQNFAANTFAPGATNPFTSGASTLNQIATGAANPWNVATDASGVQTVTPNVSTPLGGLFSAQEGLLKRIMPDITAPAEASGISSGGFGGSQQRYGVQRAKSAALADLFQKQMAEALASQQTGAVAASGLGTLGGQGVKAALDTANFPTTQLSNVANVLNAAKPGTITTKSTELAPLSQVGSLLSMVGGGGNIMDSIYGTPQIGKPGDANYKAATQGIAPLKGLMDKLGFGTGSGGGSSMPIDPVKGDQVVPGATTPGTGQYLGTDWKVYTDSSYGTGAGGSSTTTHPDYGSAVGINATGVPIFRDSNGDFVYSDGSSASVYGGLNPDTGASDPSGLNPDIDYGNPWDSTYGE